MGLGGLEADIALFSADHKQTLANLPWEQCSKNVHNMFSRRAKLRNVLMLKERMKTNYLGYFLSD